MGIMKTQIHSIPRTQLAARIKVLQTCANKRLDSAQKQYMCSHDTKARSSLTFKPGQVVFIDKPLLEASFAGSADRLTMNNYNKLLFMEMVPSGVNSFQPSTPTTDKHSIHSTVSTDRATVAIDIKPPSDVSQRFSVQDPPTNLGVNE